MSPTPDKIYSVTEITGELKSVLESEFASIWVEGEISNYLHHSSGHHYFTLKDNSAQLKAVIWRFTARGLKVELKDGLKVRAFGDITVYEKGGYYQLRVARLEAAGLGTLQQQFEALKRKLDEEGLFAVERKRPIPEYPSIIGIVTSPTGAAVRDIINICRRRAPQTRLVLRPTRVQGDEAAADIVAAIKEFNRWGKADLLIVGRGGGSLEDLWCFNEEMVARAIVSSHTPLISAVGHEIDFTISDFVADMRAPTPSAAAELATYDSAAILQFVTDARARLPIALLRVSRSLRERYLRILKNRVFRRPEVLLEGSYQQLDDLNTRFQHAIENRRSAWRARVELLTGKLSALSPDSVLKRGYSLVRRKTDDRIVTDAETLTTGDQVTISFSRGQRDARIE
jgi:exodeoxyribonuclease VII large subunit